MAELSYSRGLSSPLLEQTVWEALSDVAARLPNQEALVVRHQKVRLTYRQLLERGLDEVARIQTA